MYTFEITFASTPRPVTVVNGSVSSPGTKSKEVERWILYVYRSGEKKPLKFVEPSYRCAHFVQDTLSLLPSFQNARYHFKQEWYTYVETEAMRAREREIDAAAAPIFEKLDELRDRIDATQEWIEKKDLRSQVSCEDHVKSCLEFSAFCKNIRTFDPNDPPAMYDMAMYDSGQGRCRPE